MAPRKVDPNNGLTMTKNKNFMSMINSFWLLKKSFPFMSKQVLEPLAFKPDKNGQAMMP